MSLLLAGGATFNDSITDTVTVTDSFIGIATFFTSFLDSLTATDTYSVPMHNIANFAPRPILRDWWDRDEWGRFIPGSGIHNG